MFRVYEGLSANEIWCDIANDIKCLNDISLSQSRIGQVLDLGRTCISLRDPLQRWIVSRSPSLNPAFAIAEFVWIINGRDDAEFLNYFNRQLPHFAGDDDKYAGAYGHRMRVSVGFDQLERAYTALKNNPISRQVVLQIWNAAVDMPQIDGSPASPDVPCNVISFLKVRDMKLEWTQIMRSNDFYLGLPHNLIQFTMLHEVMAGWLGLSVGGFALVTDSLHVYEQDLPLVRNTNRSVSAENTDRLNHPRRESDSQFRQLADAIETIIDPSSDIDAVLRVSQAPRPQPLANLLCVIGAEGLRRRDEMDAATRTMNRCSNPALVEVWNNWLSRIRGLTRAFVN
jgi:thymidylate synthase